MKHIFLILTATLICCSCKKSLEACKDYKEISGRQNPIDPASVESKELRDTLAKYPQLEVYRKSNDNYSNTVICNNYFKGLLMFNSYYSISKAYNSGSVSVNGSVVTDNIAIGLSPTVSFKDAIAAAKNRVNLDHSCVSYQLGIYNINGNNTGNTDYRLAWKISSTENLYIYAIVDANNKYIILYDSGYRYID